MQTSQSKGHLFMVAHYLAVMWVEVLRDFHTWVGAFIPDSIGKIGSGINRPQRVLALCLVIMANLASSAIFLGLSEQGWICFPPFDFHPAALPVARWQRL